MATEPTLEQLKSAAYDCMVQLETWQGRLKQTNERIANFKPSEEPVVEAEVVDKPKK